MRKFDGEKETVINFCYLIFLFFKKLFPKERKMKKFKIIKLPKYLIFHFKRFTNNFYFIEKNPTIVNFPLKSLDLKEYIFLYLIYYKKIFFFT